MAQTHNISLPVKIQYSFPWKCKAQVSNSNELQRLLLPGLLCCSSELGLKKVYDRMVQPWPSY